MCKLVFIQMGGVSPPKFDQQLSPNISGCNVTSKPFNDCYNKVCHRVNYVSKHRVTDSVQECKYHALAPRLVSKGVLTLAQGISPSEGSRLKDPSEVRFTMDL